MQVSEDQIEASLAQSPGSQFSLKPGIKSSYDSGAISLAATDPNASDWRRQPKEADVPLSLSLSALPLRRFILSFQVVIVGLEHLWIWAQKGDFAAIFTTWQLKVKVTWAEVQPRRKTIQSVAKSPLGRGNFSLNK